MFSNSFFRCIAVTFLASVFSGCATLFNPYLSTKELDNATLCNDCPSAKRFETTVRNVEALQVQARDGYVQRGQVNSITSALAFPVVGWLLYRGSTATTEGARKLVLKGGIAAGSVYEARNALEANSPESVYLQADARLGCLLDEASRYKLDIPDSCKAQTAMLTNRVVDIEREPPMSDSGIEEQRKKTVARVRQLLDNYGKSDRVIDEANYSMRTAARKIVSDANREIKTPTISLSVGSGLIKSNAELFGPIPKVPEKKGPPTESFTRDANTLTLLETLVAEANNYRESCVRAQPQDTAPFAACTTYNPNAPPPPVITTTLPSAIVELKKGEEKSFVATSQPSGTPWAVLSGGTAAVISAVSLEQITLSPTQTQVRIKYLGDKAITSETSLILSIGTLGSIGNAVPITLKLHPAAGS